MGNRTSSFKLSAIDIWYIYSQGKMGEFKFQKVFFELFSNPNSVSLRLIEDTSRSRCSPTYPSGMCVKNTALQAETSGRDTR